MTSSSAAGRPGNSMRAAELTAAVVCSVRFRGVLDGVGNMLAGSKVVALFRVREAPGASESESALTATTFRYLLRFER